MTAWDLGRNLDSHRQTGGMRRSSMVRLVPLHPLNARGATGELWVNPEHIVTLQPIRSETGATTTLDVEVKMTGMNLIRVRVGSFPDAAAAGAAWREFLTALSS